MQTLEPWDLSRVVVNRKMIVEKAIAEMEQRPSELNGSAAES